MSSTGAIVAGFIAQPLPASPVRGVLIGSLFGVGSRARLWIEDQWCLVSLKGSSARWLIWHPQRQGLFMSSSIRFVISGSGR